MECGFAIIPTACFLNSQSMSSSEKDLIEGLEKLEHEIGERKLKLRELEEIGLVYKNDAKKLKKSVKETLKAVGKPQSHIKWHLQPNSNEVIRETVKGSFVGE